MLKGHWDRVEKVKGGELDTSAGKTLLYLYSVASEGVRGKNRLFRSWHRHKRGHTWPHGHKREKQCGLSVQAGWWRPGDPPNNISRHRVQNERSCF